MKTSKREQERRIALASQKNADKITELADWNDQYNNYDATTPEAMDALVALGFYIYGEGAETEYEALVGFIADDSGYKSRNLDYAKSYSGYRADKRPITVITPTERREYRKTRNAEKKEKGERKNRRNGAMAHCKVGATVEAEARYGKVSVTIERLDTDSEGELEAYGKVNGNDREWVVYPLSNGTLLASYA